ncbi:unnamed protein product [Cylicocyclus nassatus]|uniref:Uncharacterized protein n=1 Tax=Cylicocyclus nassatus TaxID=53992 RepID=A0AA36M8B6_CYLNA|nr:unnamed protein product [Cylicocyclus nassatus]
MALHGHMPYKLNLDYDVTSENVLRTPPTRKRKNHLQMVFSDENAELNKTGGVEEKPMFIAHYVKIVTDGCDKPRLRGSKTPIEVNYAATEISMAPSESAYKPLPFREMTIAEEVK